MSDAGFRFLALATDADHAAVEALTAAAGAPHVLVPLSTDLSRLRLGDALPVVAIWSPAAMAQGLAGVLAEALAHDARGSVVWRVGDAPWPADRTLDPHTVLLDAQDPAAVVAALRLAGRRMRAQEPGDAAAGERAPSGGRWPAIAIVVAAAAVLAAAGGTLALQGAPLPAVALPASDAAQAPVAPPPAAAAQVAPSTAADETPPPQPSTADTPPGRLISPFVTYGETAPPAPRTVIAPDRIAATASATAPAAAPGADPRTPAGPARPGEASPPAEKPTPRGDDDGAQPVGLRPPSSP